jgi:hypothetical protein
LLTVPVAQQALAPPPARDAPPPAAPRPAPPGPPTPPEVQPRPGPRPSADAPLAGTSRAGLSSGPAGSAPPPGGWRPPVTPGPARRVPWATVSRETEPRPWHRHPVRSPPVRASAGSQCPLTKCPARPALGFVRLGPGGQGGRPSGVRHVRPRGGGCVPGQTAPHWRG